MPIPITGLEFMIKVMAGDKVDIFGKSYYQNTVPVNNANSVPLDLLTLMGQMLLGSGSRLLLISRFLTILFSSVDEKSDKLIDIFEFE